VLKGAKALAIPTLKGQHLTVEESNKNQITWRSLDQQGEEWLSVNFSTEKLNIEAASDMPLATKLQSILLYVADQKPELFSQALNLSTQLDFDRSWGWGTSSSLISLLSQWSGVDGHDILKNTIGGSGYDVACAQAEGPIFFELDNDRPIVSKAPIPKFFIDNLYLVYLGKKQKSSDAISEFEKRGEVDEDLIRQVNRLTQMVAKSADLGTFCACLQELERLTGDFLNRQPVQEQFFKTLPGAAKSLGAWGGDFVLLATPWPQTKVEELCNDLGFSTVLNFKQTVKY